MRSPSSSECHSPQRNASRSHSPKPVDRGRELALEREPAHLAVRDDVEPGVLLQRERFVDGPVLDLLEGGVRELAGFEPPPCLEQSGRSEEAADDVGASVEHRAA